MGPSFEPVLTLNTEGHHIKYVTAISSNINLFFISSLTFGVQVHHNLRQGCEVG